MAKLIHTVLAAAVAGLVAVPALAADKSLTPEHKPAPLSPHAKPGSKAAEEALRAAITPYERMEEVFSGDTTVAGEKFQFPKDNIAVKSIIVTLAPGEKTAWHKHHAPLFSYVLEGEVTVSYDGLGKKLYREGDGLMEALDMTHQGHNTGETPARILNVFMTGDGKLPTVLEQAPGETRPAIQ
ncbi:cupin domain-containing protein [Roseibium sediminis]|uniref:cupin domain-containing protein n=1 Tax=Roseibium sediminis TaxID=1775174 RepID=UPI00123DF9F0|nr:cupin domain-containing protein [Roseibium sediminis]